METFDDFVKDPRKLISYVEQLKARSKARFTQYEEDEALWRMDEYVLEEVAENARAKKGDYPSYTGNEARNYLDVMVSALNRFPLLWRGEPVGGGEKLTGQEEEISAHERFATGVCREIDVLRQRRAEMPLQHDVALYHALRAGSAIRPWILSKAPVSPFRAELWDLWDCVWDMGQNGMVFFGHNYLAAKHDLLQTWEYEEDPKKPRLKADEDGNVDVFDCWWMDSEWDVWNAVLSPGGAQLKEPKNHTTSTHLDHIPVILTRAGGVPFGPHPGKKGQEYLRDQWQSIFAANRRMYATYNRIASLYMLIIRSGAIGPYAIKLSPGQPRLSEQELASVIRPFGRVQGVDDIKAVAPPEIADSAKELWQATLGSIQRGSVPHTIYGQTPFELTGIAISQLQGALDLKLVNQRNALKSAYRGMIDEFIQQFIRLRRRKVTLAGLDRRNRPFSDEFSSAELRTKYYLEPELRIDLPITQQQEANIARMWQQLGVPLEIIFDQLIHLQDPRAAYERKMAEMADMEPPVRDMKRAFHLTEMAGIEQDPERQELMLRMRDFFVARVSMITGEGGGEGGETPGAEPGILSPEMAGQSEQHLQAFTRGPQHTPGVGPPGRRSVEERKRGRGTEKG